MLTATLNCLSPRDVCERKYRQSDHSYRVSQDNPENGLKIPRLGTEFKCPAISQINSFCFKSMWQRCLAATVSAYCTAICTLGSILKNEETYCDFKEAVIFLNLKKSVSLDQLCKEFYTIKPTLALFINE